jgi:thiol-disulfide isomerase/thioredoxin
MKQTIIYQILRKSFLVIIVLGIVLTTGCTTEKWTTSDEQEKTKAEDQVQEQDQAGGDTETVGLINFKTKDIYGNDVNQDIFKDYKLTLVNVWGTFCGPCLDEMPFLGELQNEYEPKGVNIVGIVVDVQDEDMEVNEDQIKLAKEIADTTGANYTHMIISFDMLQLMNQFDAIPASFFVDSDGNVVSEYYIGSRSKEDWVDIIETNLEKQQ